MEPCPNCTSVLAQPMRWNGGPVRLRCPECESCFVAGGSAKEVEAAQTVARQAVLDAYDASVGESMAALADRWREALARDLLSADDFARVF